MDVAALILSGGSAGDWQDSVANKGLIEIGDRPMVQYLLEALENCSHIGRVGLVMPQESAREWPSPVTTIPAQGTLTQNIRAGLEALDDHDAVLILAADIPLVTTEALNDFLARCVGDDSQKEPDGRSFLCYPVIRKEDAERSFPGVRRTYAKLREGTFTGGNLVLAHRQTVLEQLSLLDTIYEIRKNPLRLLRLIGFRLLIRYLVIGLSIKDLEGRISDIIGGTAKAIITPYPEIGVDVDKAEDLELVREMLTS